MVLGFTEEYKDGYRDKPVFHPTVGVTNYDMLDKRNFIFPLPV